MAPRPFDMPYRTQRYDDTARCIILSKVCPDTHIYIWQDTTRCDSWSIPKRERSCAQKKLDNFSTLMVVKDYVNGNVCFLFVLALVRARHAFCVCKTICVSQYSTGCIGNPIRTKIYDTLYRIGNANYATAVKSMFYLHFFYLASCIFKSSLHYLRNNRPNFTSVNHPTHSCTNRLSES